MGNIENAKDLGQGIYTQAEIDTEISNIPNSSGKSALLKGSFSLSNTTSVAGMATKLYTGNGSTQSIDAGVDLATQWGDNANETYGGLVWIKKRSGADWHIQQDTVRGLDKYLASNGTYAEFTEGDADGIQSYTSTGFTLGFNNSYTWNESGATFASWIFQTTHRITGTTNHGKAYTCHYNPITGFTIVKYEGSGIAGHEIPHHLGRELGLFHIKALTSVQSWSTQYFNDGRVQLNTTNATSSSLIHNNTEDSISIVDTDNAWNGSGNSYVIYGWANSYYDDAGVLNGNYEVGIYQGTGASGNKITTRGKPAWVIIKQLDSANSWNIHDNQRTQGYRLKADSSEAEATTEYVSFQEDGFTIVNYTSANHNTSGGQYLYMVVYGESTGKSLFDMPSETSNIQVGNGVVSITNGVGSNGVNNSITDLGSFTISPTGGFDI